MNFIYIIGSDTLACIINNTYDTARMLNKKGENLKCFKIIYLF
jgi:hypothetical protein